MELTLVYLSLGGNLGNVLFRLQKAFHYLQECQHITVLRSSHFYQTKPIGFSSSSKFINAVYSFLTDLPPYEIFKITQAIEIKLDKVKKPKDASRLIDIDILFYGHSVQKIDDLEIPHPHWKERLFVLKPLQDLTNEIILYGKSGPERYVLEKLIQPLEIQDPFAVSLLTHLTHTLMVRNRIF